jgi:hypothetical protein
VVKTLAKLTIGVAILVASAWFGTSFSRAYGDAAWCTVINAGPGTVYCDCQYRTIEECVQDVIGGNRGFCNLNPWRVRFRQCLTNIITDMLARRSWILHDDQWLYGECHGHVATQGS